MDEVQRRLRLEGLFDAHAGAVRAYARRRIDATAADDTVAEVFATAWRRLDDVPEEALPWLLGCARRVIAHQHRRASRDTELLERLKPVAGGPETDGGKLAWALSTLSARDRELLLFDRVGRAGAHGGGRGAWLLAHGPSGAAPSRP